MPFYTSEISSLVVRARGRAENQSRALAEDASMINDMSRQANELLMLPSDTPLVDVSRNDDASAFWVLCGVYKVKGRTYTMSHGDTRVNVTVARKELNQEGIISFAPEFVLGMLATSDVMIDYEVLLDGDQSTGNTSATRERFYIINGKVRAFGLAPDGSMHTMKPRNEHMTMLQQTFEVLGK